jgi:hypothetical protein
MKEKALDYGGRLPRDFVLRRPRALNPGQDGSFDDSQSSTLQLIHLEKLG